MHLPVVMGMFDKRVILFVWRNFTKDNKCERQTSQNRFAVHGIILPRGAPTMPSVCGLFVSVAISSKPGLLHFSSQEGR